LRRPQAIEIEFFILAAISAIALSMSLVGVVRWLVGLV